MSNDSEPRNLEPRDVEIEPYTGPVGGWGSARSVTEIVLRERVPIKGPATLLHQNKPHGFACVSCSYAQASHIRSRWSFARTARRPLLWEITDRRCTPQFFAQHTVSELEALVGLRA